MTARERAIPIVALRLLLVVAGALPWALALLGLHTAALVDGFHALCHQLPERTLSVHGAPMLVCSRCAGVYAGIAVGAVLAMPRSFLPRARTLVVVALTLVLVDVATQDLGLHAPWSVTRLATGALLGWSVSAFLVGALLGAHTASQGPQPTLSPKPEA